MNKEFKYRLSKALKDLREKLHLLPTRSQNLYTPVFRDGDYEWALAMGTDGLLIAERKVVAGEERELRGDSFLKVGVVIQSEFSTSDTKPNPFGKGAVGRIPLGVWIDLKNGTRVRLDRVYVLFVLPRSAAPKHRTRFETAKRNARNVADTLPDVRFHIVKKGKSVEAIFEEIRGQVSHWLRGRGRPRKARRSSTN